MALLALAATVTTTGCASDDEIGDAAAGPTGQTGTPLRFAHRYMSKRVHRRPPAVPSPGPAPAPAPTPADVETGPATPLGITAFSANGRVHPHGRAMSSYIEYGATAKYGSRTAGEDLGPKLAAFYRETWDEGLGGWAGGMDGAGLIHYKTKGVSGGFVRFHADSGDDSNHEDGIGYVRLPQYLHNGTYFGAGIANPYMGGGDTDMRDARISIDVRGNTFRPNGAEIMFWAQSDSDLAEQNGYEWRRANWAFTGFTLTDALLAGGWQHVDYQLLVDTTKWTYAGHSVAQNRPNYEYWPISETLRHLNCNFFHILVMRTLAETPSGSMDFDELTIRYRNHSLLLPSNGGRVKSTPAGSSDSAMLTDGWRNGDGRSWQTAPDPTGPQEIVYALARPVVVNAVQIHQDLANPSREIEVLVSSDGVEWRSVVGGELPETSPDGPNYAHLFQQNLSEAAQLVKIRILSGYRSGPWGLGEIEVFGTGAVMETDDDWYTVSADVDGLQPGSTVHYRVVATDGERSYPGPDRIYRVPSTGAPILIDTGVATHLTNRSVDLVGRLAPMGLPTEFWYEFGTTTDYDDLTNPAYAGVGLGARPAGGGISYLKPRTTYHYRLVARNEAGTVYGDDHTFTTPR